MELLIGCGHSRERRVTFSDIPKTWTQLVTLDINDACEPDFLHDLNMLPYPFDDNLFDEIHAYEVLEHCGTQGDYRFFFQQFEEFHRILKPDGYLIGSCPNWHHEWAWADPGHRRIITPRTLTFLFQKTYIEAEEKDDSALADYRYCYTADFEPVAMEEKPEGNWYFIIKALK